MKAFSEHSKNMFLIVLLRSDIYSFSGLGVRVVWKLLKSSGLAKPSPLHPRFKVRCHRKPAALCMTVRAVALDIRCWIRISQAHHRYLWISEFQYGDIGNIELVKGDARVKPSCGSGI